MLSGEDLVWVRLRRICASLRGLDLLACGSSCLMVWRTSESRMRHFEVCAVLVAHGAALRWFVRFTERGLKY